MPPRHRRDYTLDYPGPRCSWPNNDAHDWVALFPIPPRHQIDPPPSPPQHTHRERITSGSDQGRDEDDDEEEEEEDFDDDGDDDFWLSPRMACMLYYAGCTYVDTWIGGEFPEDEGMFLRDLPEIAQPFARIPEWREAYDQAAKRIVARLEKGRAPRPNCTGEEMALHRIMDIARAFYTDGDEGMLSFIEPLPVSTKDEDFNMVLELLVDDEDVLMLYDTPQLANPRNHVAQMMDMACLHPSEWFRPFDTYRIDDHVMQQQQQQ